MSPRLSLLQLPDEFMKSLLNNLQLFEIVALAKCSETMRQVIKSTEVMTSFEDLLKNQNGRLTSAMELIQHFRLDTTADEFHRQVKLSVRLSPKLVFYLQIKGYEVFPILIKNEDSKHFQMETSKMRDSLSCYTHTYWKSSLDGFCSLLDFFKEHLDLELDKFSLDERVDESLLRGVIQFMKNKDHSVKSLCISKHSKERNLSAEDFHFILKNLKVTRSHESNVEVKGPIPSIDPFHVAWLTIHHANWFNLDLLLKTEAQHVRLFGTNLKNVDLVEYLWRWISMMSPVKNLKTCRVEIEGKLNVREIFVALRDRLVEKRSKNGPRFALNLDDDNYIKVIRGDCHVAWISIPKSEKKMVFQMFTLPEE